MTSWRTPLGLAGAGAGLLAWAAYHPASQLFGPTRRRVEPGELALTFDDGPNPAVTPRLLDLLARYNVGASFFLVGRFVDAHPDLAAEIAQRGHTIGNHTTTHPSLVWQPPARIAGEITACQDSIERATGGRPVWFRPPFGYRGPQLNGVVRQLGLSGVAMWSKTEYDWRDEPRERLVRRLGHVAGGDIVLLHDGSYREQGADRHRTVDALEHWLPRWIDGGLRLVTL
ncbi:MAG TPA: polysaccharide deacetylase family protein [Vicinamibacterales bacterium]|jgi:peptidoglycan/xylan/chitin deacetylase (PgdA/CDA1 family)